MIEALIGFLKGKTRGQLVGLLMIQVSVFLFLGVLAAQGGISSQRIEACAKNYNTGEALLKYHYLTASDMCADIITGKLKPK